MGWNIHLYTEKKAILIGKTSRITHKWITADVWEGDPLLEDNLGLVHRPIWEGRNTELFTALGLHSSDRPQLPQRGLPDDLSFQVAWKAMDRPYREVKSMRELSLPMLQVQEFSGDARNHVGLKDLESFDWDRYKCFSFPMVVLPRLREIRHTAMEEMKHNWSYQVASGEEVVRIVYWFT